MHFQSYENFKDAMIFGREQALSLMKYKMPYNPRNFKRSLRRRVNL